MWSLQLRPFSLTVLQSGGLCWAFFQPVNSEAACEPAESCLDYQEPSSSLWYLWFCMSLFLAMILLCVALCCLQHWLTRCRRFSSQHTVAVFALSDVNSEYGNDAVPEMPPKVQLHPLSLERYHPSSSKASMAGHGLPPSYEEIVKQGSARPEGPSRDGAPGEQQSRRGPAKDSR